MLLSIVAFTLSDRFYSLSRWTSLRIHTLASNLMSSNRLISLSPRARSRNVRGRSSAVSSLFFLTSTSPLDHT